MTKIELTSQETKTERIVLELPEPAAGFCSFFAWSLNKAGSTLLTNMLADYFAAVKLPVLNVPGLLFKSGLSSNIGASEYEKILHQEGFAYIGWRNPAALRVKYFDFRRVNNILLVRDPRDRLVSSYFSIAYSHEIPKSGSLKETMVASRKTAQTMVNVNEWLRSNPREFTSFLMGLSRFHDKLPPETTRVYRYEDIIYRKKEFLTDVIEYAGAPFDEAVIEEVALRHDVRPSKERPEKHIRQVKFGNYKEHFNEETTAIIDEQYGLCLDAYDFNNETEFGKRLVYAKEGAEAKALFGRKIVRPTT